MLIKRVQKAPTDPITDADLQTLKYPLVGSPKLDGFRCIVDERGGRTSSMKPFSNRFIDTALRNPAFFGHDGEIIVGSPFKENEDDDVFHRTSGPIRRFDGEPDFRLYVFDNWRFGDLSYYERWLKSVPYLYHPRIVVLEQRLLTNAAEVLIYEKEMVELGYEGAMIRSLEGRYKEGRCTLREQNIFKRKPFEECDAEIIGLEEAMENLNEKVVDAQGLSKRSSHQENKYPKDTLGMFVLLSTRWSKPFKAACGKGFNDAEKKKIWDDRHSYLGRVCTVKYQKYGSIDAPRMPKVTRIRDNWDV
jgi:DNA ligase-1